MPSLAHEIRKRNPFDSPKIEAYLNIMRTAAAFGCAAERLFREFELCPTHYNILRILAGEKSGGVDGLPVLEVRQRLITPVPDITRLVDKLVAQRLVRRERIASDRRVVLLKLTERGGELLERMKAPVNRLHGELLDHMDDGELTTLSRLLEKARSRPK